MTASPLRLDRKRICLHLQGAKCAAVNEISGFRLHVCENFAVPGSTRRWMVVRVVHQPIRTVPRSRVKQVKTERPETSVNKDQRSVKNKKNEDLSQHLFLSALSIWNYGRAFSENANICEYWQVLLPCLCTSIARYQTPLGSKPGVSGVKWWHVCEWWFVNTWNGAVTANLRV
jgi:hypothetical protein